MPPYSLPPGESISHIFLPWYGPLRRGKLPTHTLEIPKDSGIFCSPLELAWCLGACPVIFFNHPVGPVCQEPVFAGSTWPSRAWTPITLERHVPSPLPFARSNYLHELPFHIFQVLPFVGTELVQHLGFLAMVLTDVPPLISYLHYRLSFRPPAPGFYKASHQGRQSGRSNLSLPKSVVGMTAPGADLYPEALGTHRPVHDAGKGTVKGTKALYPAAVVLADLTHSPSGFPRPSSPAFDTQQKSRASPASFQLENPHAGYIFPCQQKTYQTCRVVSPRWAQ